MTSKDTKVLDKHIDIIILEKRLKICVEMEEYERAAIIKRWIDELSENKR
jgi:protein-arginine kinase activator protein McsA